MFMSAELRERFDRDGFLILPSHLPIATMQPAVDELHVVFPTAEEFHGNVDPDRNLRFRDEFGGIDDFPFASVELSLLSVHPALIDLAGELCGVDQLRVYSIEAWAKYTGAADYDQHGSPELYEVEVTGAGPQPDPGGALDGRPLPASRDVPLPLRRPARPRAPELRCSGFRPRSTPTGPTTPSPPPLPVEGPEVVRTTNMYLSADEFTALTVLPATELRKTPPSKSTSARCGASSRRMAPRLIHTVRGFGYLLRP